ncbi:P-loop containing nucleoside triphosphate hydrolase protein, partial [Mycena latifolia]
PPRPQIFHGRETELNQVVYLLKQDSARIAILGPGGMGKTSLAQAALHNLEVVAQYSTRHFVPCNSSLTCADLISNISSHLGLKNERASSTEILKHFSSTEAALLVLDNLETTWESLLFRPEVENFLSLLAGIPQLALVITMRGAQRPDKVKWTRPCPRPLTPLSDSAALQVFIDIADSDHDDACVRKLLAHTGNLPLAISLMANVAGYEGCERTLSRWEKESTRLLSDGYDQRSSLDISIMLSFSSPRMNSGAQKLLGLLSMLPDGLSDADLIHSRLPIANILSCKATLIQVCLAYMDTTGNTPRLMSLVPIREHIRGAYPPSPVLKRHLRQHFHHILRRGTPGLWWILPENLPQAKNVLGNCHNLLADALSNPEECPDMDEVIDSVIDLNASMRHAGIGSSQLIDHVNSYLVGRPASSSHRFYSIEILRDRSRPLREIEAYIDIATRYFENTSDEEKGPFFFFNDHRRF